MMRNTVEPNVSLSIDAPYVRMSHMIRPMSKEDAETFLRACRDTMYKKEAHEFLSAMDTVRIAGELGLLKRGMVISFNSDLADKGWDFAGSTQYFMDNSKLYVAAEENDAPLYGIMFPYYNVYC